MNVSMPFNSKPRALAAAIAVAVSMGGCATVPQASVSDSGIIPIQRHSGVLAEPLPTHRYERGRDHFNAGRYGLALDEFKAELAAHPRSIMALNGMAAVYDKLGRYDLAVSYYYRALQIDPDSTRTLANLGYSFLLQQRPDAASGVLELAAALEPDNAVVARNLKLASEAMAAMPAQEPAQIAAPATAPRQATPPTPSVASVQPALPQAEFKPKTVAVVVVPPPVVEVVEPSDAQPAASGLPRSTESPLARDVSAVEAPVPEPAVIVEVPATPAPAPVTVAAAIVEQAPADMPTPAVAIATQSYEEVAETTPVEPLPTHDALEVPAPAPHVAAVDPAPPAAEPLPAFELAGPAEAEQGASVVTVVGSVPSQAVVIVEGTAPASMRKVSERTGHVQLAFDTPEGSVEVSNGNGYEGMARLLSRYYAGLGQQIAHVTNADDFDHDHTVIYYQPGKRAMAETLQASLPVPATLRERAALRTDARVVLGHDIAFYRGALRRLGLAEAQGHALAAGDFSLPDSRVRIEVSNGNGRNGMARLLSRVLDNLGGQVARITNADDFTYPTTVIHYAAGQEQAARALADRLPVQATLKPVPGQQDHRRVGVRVIIGRDFLRYEEGMRDLLATMPQGSLGV